jgi:hypothetical protein
MYGRMKVTYIVISNPLPNVRKGKRRAYELPPDPKVLLNAARGLGDPGGYSKLKLSHPKSKLPDARHPNCGKLRCWRSPEP